MANVQDNRCAGNINSLADIRISRRDLVRLHDHLSYLQNGLKEMGTDISDIQKRIYKLSRDADRLGTLFDSLFGDQISSVIGGGTIISSPCLSAEEKLLDAMDSELITLGPDRQTWKQMLSTIDIIRRVEEEFGGIAPREEVLAQTAEIHISSDKLDQILNTLKKSGALAESEDAVRLI